MKKNRWIAIPLVFSLVTAALIYTSCVTVNVNIPDSAVQQATDDYVKELYDAKEKSKPAAPAPARSPQSMLDFVIAPAFADDRPVKTDSPKALDIRTRMKERLDEVHADKMAGILGETNTGKLIVKGKAKSGQEKSLKKLMDDENSDRAELYHEVIEHNGMNKGNLETIERNFAHSFQKHSPTGTWVQDDDGAWTQKP
jgi:uncharacterized protein YdbL (DUF1318 family)